MEKLLKQTYICFPGGKHKALTMSYDDGQIFDRKLVGMFNEYGLKGTFHINGGLYGRPERITPEETRDLYKGHEVSCHTYTHPTIERFPLDQVVQQIIEDRKVLESLVGYPVRGLSYPNGSYTEDIKKLLPACGIEYARVVETTGNFGMPRDFLEWKATCHHGNKQLMTLADNFLNLHKTQYLYLMYVWGHSYEFDRDNSWDMIEGFCDRVGHHDDDIWYATNIEIVDYMKAARNLKYTARADAVYNPSALTMYIRTDEKFYEIGAGETVVIDK